MPDSPPLPQTTVGHHWQENLPHSPCNLHIGESRLAFFLFVVGELNNGGHARSSPARRSLEDMDTKARGCPHSGTSSEVPFNIVVALRSPIQDRERGSGGLRCLIQIKRISVETGGNGRLWAAGTKKCSLGTSLGHRLVREAMHTDHERWTDSTNYTVCALAL